MQDSHSLYLMAAYAITALLIVGELILLRIQSRRVQQQQEQD